MATNTWSRVGSAGVWSTDADWSLGHKPQAGEDIVFDGTSVQNCTVDEATAALGTFTIAAAYTGTYNDGGFAHTIAGDVSITPGGTFTASGTWTQTGDGNYTLANSGTYSVANKSIVLQGTGTFTIAKNGYQINNLSCAAAGKATTISGMAANTGWLGTITSGAGTLTLNSDVLWVGDGANVTPFAVTGTTFLGSSTFKIYSYHAAAAPIITLPALSVGTNTILMLKATGNNSVVTFSLSGAISCANLLVYNALSSATAGLIFLTNGNAISTSLDISVGSTVAAGVFTATYGASIISCATYCGTAYNVGTSNINMGSSQWTCTGAWTMQSNHTIVPGTSKVTFIGNSSTFTGAGKALHDVTVNKNAGQLLTVASSFTYDGTWDIQAGYIILPAQTLASAFDLPDRTFYLTGDLSTGAFNLTNTGVSAGSRTVFKTSGAFGIRVTGTGTCVLSYVDFTSRNDDSLGEAIAGSTGAPAAADQTVGYVIRTGTDTTTVSLTNWTANYSNVTNSCVVGWTDNSPTSTFSVINGEMTYCRLAAGDFAAFVGTGVGNKTNGDATVQNIKIGATNSVASAFCRGFNFTTANGNTSVRQLFYTPTGSATFGLVVGPSANSSIVIQDCIIVCNVVDAASTGVLAVQSIGVGNVSAVVKNNTVINTGTGDGIMVYRSAGTLTVSVANNIIKDCDGAAAVGLNRNGVATVTHTNNVYWNNTTNCFEALHATEVEADPMFGNLPAGVSIRTDLTPFPDGYAVLNPAVRAIGSQTFAAAGVDPSIYSATGERFRWDDMLTPGAMYALMWPEGGYGIDESKTGIGIGNGIVV
jgi:hypothetical protein